MHPWLNWIEHLTTDQEVASSSLAGCTNIIVLIFYMSVIFLSILIIIAILAIFCKKKKLAIILQIIFLISFYLSGSGLAVLFLMPNLELSANHKNIAPAWQKNNVIVVLGAGNIKLPQSNIIKPSFFSYSRIYEAANLYFLCKKSANQCNIITSGGDVSKFGKSEAEIYLEHLIALGVNKDDIIRTYAPTQNLS